MTYDEIKDLDIGSWFSQKFSSERITTLQQAMDLARDRIKLNIELKFNGHDQALTERVVELIRDNEFAEQSVVTSLDYEALRQAEQLAPNVQTGAIVSASVGDITQLGVDFLSLVHSLATSDMVAHAHRRKLAVHVWTINDEIAMRQMINRGVDNIITDRPERLAAVLKERFELNDTERLILSVGLWLRDR